MGFDDEAMCAVFWLAVHSRISFLAIVLHTVGEVRRGIQGVGIKIPVVAYIDHLFRQVNLGDIQHAIHRMNLRNLA